VALHGALRSAARALALLLAGLLCATFTAAGRAFAQNPGSVLIVRVDGDDAIVSRLRAELRHEDWRVVELPARSADSRRSLEALARERAASAGLRARPTQLAVELWVAAAGDRDKGGSEEVLAGPRADLGVLAVRVTEVLRARGLVPPRPDDRGGSAVATATASDREGGAKPAPTSAPAEGDGSPRSGAAASGTAASGAAAAIAAPHPAASTPPPDKPPPQPAPVEAHAAEPPPSAAANPEPAEPKPSETAPASAEEPSQPEAESGDESPVEPPFPALVYVELAPALVLSPGGVGPSFDLFGNVRVQPIESVSFSCFVLAPLLQNTVSTKDGYTTVRTLGIGGSADLQLPFAAVWEFSAGVGAAALVTWLQGHATNPSYMARDETQRTAAVLARVGLSWRLTSTLRLSGRVLVGFAIPELQIKFPNQTAAHWGEPFVMAALGLEFALPWQR
jgi:hypothetical protein